MRSRRHTHGQGRRPAAHCSPRRFRSRDDADRGLQPLGVGGAPGWRPPSAPGHGTSASLGAFRPFPCPTREAGAGRPGAPWPPLSLPVPSAPSGHLLRASLPLGAPPLLGVRVLGCCALVCKQLLWESSMLRKDWGSVRRWLRGPVELSLAGACGGGSGAVASFTGRLGQASVLTLCCTLESTEAAGRRLTGRRCPPAA